MFEYLAILIFLLATAFFIHKMFHLRLFTNTKHWLTYAGSLFIIGWIWDTFAIWRGHWAYPPGNTLGIVIGNIPLEDYLFAFIVPYFAITLYKLFESKLSK